MSESESESEPEPQRILMIFESFGVGGAEIAALGLLGALADRGHICHAVALWGPDDLAPRLEEAGVSTHQLGLSHRWRTDQAARRLGTLIRRLKPTVVHAQLFFAGFYSALTRPLTPDPVRVVTFQNLGYESYPANTTLLRIRKRMDSAAMRRGVDARIAVSQASAAHYEKHLGVEIDAVIHNGVRAREIAAADRPDRASLSALAPADGQIVLCPARFVHEKGHRFLLDAVALMRDRGLTPAVLLAGDGPLREEIAAGTTALELDSQVRSLGPVPHEKLLDLMRIADVVVLPSTHEGFPVAVAEACSAGAGVVASNVGGLPDLIVDGVTGRLVAAGDPGALASGLQDLLGDEELRRSCGREAVAKAIETCDISEVAVRHEELYATLRRSRGAAS